MGDKELKEQIENLKSINEELTGQIGPLEEENAKLEVQNELLKKEVDSVKEELRKFKEPPPPTGKKAEYKTNTEF